MVQNKNIFYFELNELSLSNDIDICNEELLKNKNEYEQNHNKIKINPDTPLLSKKIINLNCKFEKKLTLLEKLQKEKSDIKKNIEIEKIKNIQNNKHLEKLNNALLNKQEILNQEKEETTTIQKELRLLKK